MSFAAPAGFLTPVQAAKAWSTRERRVSRRTVVAWCTLGLIPGARKVPLAALRVRSVREGRPSVVLRPAFAWCVPSTAKAPDVKRGRPPGT